ncbi:MAG: NAD(P)/FAD-dependent oxidoreductase [Methylophilaceae bacterium]|nr:NAD(P)/FAD-dependent oxidoreductase [Methylophilaceae bacterium]
MSDLCIIGGGHAAGRLVNNLQHLGYNGNISIYSEEGYLPYERPPLSKSFLLGEKSKEEFEIHIDKKKIKFFLNTRIVKIDFEKKIIIDHSDNNYSYQQLVFANGASPKKLFIEEIRGINYLRNINDSLHIKKNIAKSKNIILLGGGYISLEISSSIKKKYPNKKITIIDSSEKILFRNSNDDLRELIMKYHKLHNVKFLFNTKIKEIQKNKNASIEVIHLDNNKVIECDLLIVGIGVIPNTDILKDTCLYEKNGITVNEFCETSVKNVYAIGDIAIAKNNYLKMHTREESWNNAEKQSNILAHNLIGNKIAYDEIPWFWTDQFDQNFQILGIINDFDIKIIRNYEDNKKTFLYIKNNRINGAIAENNGRDISIIRKILKKNIVPNLEKLQNININLKELL